MIVSKGWALMGFLLAGWLNASAQNLVPNPGFETFGQCPPYPGQIHLAEFWDAPNNQTTDFFHRCAPPETGASVPHNLVGKQEPHQGNGYAGLRAWVPVIEGNPSYREYLTVALNAALQAGERYELRAWLSVAEASSHISDGIGFLFTAAPLPARPIYPQVPQLRFPEAEALEERDAWVPFTAVYQAAGGERYLTIGNFLPDASMLRLPDNDQPPTVYYYLDDITLQPCDPPAQLYAVVDTLLCEGEPLLLSAPEGAAAYQWSDGRRARERWVEQPGSYTLYADWVCYRTETRFRVESRDCRCHLRVPNPLSTGRRLVLPSHLEELRLELFDALGRKVGAYDEATWGQLGRWHPAGLYFWRAELRCGATTRAQSGKVVWVE